MRFALRNKDKLVKALGFGAYQLLLDSLKYYASNNDEIVDKCFSSRFQHYVFLAPNIRGSGFFKFAITKKMYDVVHVAYISHVESKNELLCS